VLKIAPARPIDRRMAETIEDLERCNKVLYSVILQKEPPMKPAGQMTLTLTEELEQFVRDEVRRGAFASSSEYVRTLVRERYLKQREDGEKLKALDEALARGLADAKAGRTMPLDEAFRRLKSELKGPKRKPAS
jgi:antitoxin ParD1/3/4